MPTMRIQSHTIRKTKHGKVNAKHMFRIIINTIQLNASFMKRNSTDHEMRVKQQKSRLKMEK